MINEIRDDILHEITQYYEGSPETDKLLLYGEDTIPVIDDAGDEKSIFLETEQGFFRITVKPEGPHPNLSGKHS